MNQSTAFDPHLNRIVPVTYYSPNGTNSTIRLFNPYGFQSYVYHAFNIPMFPNQSLAVTPAVACYFPLSGNYGMLNRILFVTEIVFALFSLGLGYPPWLASIAVAAVLNYTAVAAIHLIVLRCLPNNSALDLDNEAAGLLVINSIFFAYPLLQWSETLRKKSHNSTRVIVALWAILLSITAAIGEYWPTHFPAFPPVAEIFFDNFSAPRALLVGTWYADTVNPIILDVSQTRLGSENGQIRSCSSMRPEYASRLRQGTSLVPAPHYPQLATTNSYVFLTKVFAVYAIITLVATVTATMHGKHSTKYIRAKAYLTIAGKHQSRSRRFCAYVLSLTYYFIHLIVGIFSLPIAIVIFVLDEMVLDKYPSSDSSTYIGQWGPWVGAAIIFLAVGISKSSLLPTVRDLILWFISSCASWGFPGSKWNRKRPSLKPNLSLIKKGNKGLGATFSFFNEEFKSTRYWILEPENSSIHCIQLEHSKTADDHKPLPSLPRQKGLGGLGSEHVLVYSNQIKDFV